MQIITQTLIDTYTKLSENPSEFSERDRLILSFPVYNVSEPFQDDILEAYDYYQIHPDKFDGTTGAKENWVTKYEPPSMRHDLDYQTYGGTFKGRLYADLKFLQYKEMYEVSSLWRNIQYYAVRWGGYLFQFKNWVKGKTGEVPQDKLDLVNMNRSKTIKFVEWSGVITILPVVICVLGALIIEIKWMIGKGWKFGTRYLRSAWKKLWNAIKRK